MQQPRVKIQTTMGDITVELCPEEAPKTVENFLGYVDSGFFAGTVFHRVIPGFMIQGGGLTPDMQSKGTGQPIQNEAANGLKNEFGAIAMARTNDPHSATSQFFINTADNQFLNHQGPANFGYCVFGKVVDGEDVVRKIEAVPTTSRAGHRDVPQTPVVIQTIERVEG